MRWLCVVLAVLPFLSLYPAHYLSQEGATGFIQLDQPYYTANGRAIFERGNGLAYPNPYDPSPDAPAIYFHWFVWLLGFGVVKLGFDPGLQYVVLGVAAALWCGWATLRLVEHVLPNAKYRAILFFLTMWCGGALCLAQIASNVIEKRPMGHDILALDPMNGWWFLYWGRNVCFTTEALYHAIVATVWLAVLGNRCRLALLGCALLALTHPFSGMQLLLTLFVWFAYPLITERNRRSLQHLAATTILAGCFFGYNILFLGSFESHRALKSVWMLMWVLPVSSLLLSHLPIGLCAAWPKPSGYALPRQTTIFLVICAVVSLLLAKHEWFASPHQPLHFTRGYTWMPLCLLALPNLQAMIVAIRRRVGGIGLVVTIAAVAPLAVLDNAIFIVQQWRGEPTGAYLSPASREMYEWINGQGLSGVLLSSDPGALYLSATYTPMRPYFGHGYNTPEYADRVQRAYAWVSNLWSGSLSGDIPEVDYLILPRNQAMVMMGQHEWKLVHETHHLTLWERAVAAGGRPHEQGGTPLR